MEQERQIHDSEIVGEDLGCEGSRKPTPYGEKYGQLPGDQRQGRARDGIVSRVIHPFLNLVFRSPSVTNAVLLQINN